MSIDILFKHNPISIPATSVVQNTNVFFLIVHAAVIAVNVLPAPQGSTIIPLRARPTTLENRDNDLDEPKQSTAKRALFEGYIYKKKLKMMDYIKIWNFLIFL